MIFGTATKKKKKKLNSFFRSPSFIMCIVQKETEGTDMCSEGRGRGRGQGEDGGHQIIQHGILV